MLIPKASHLVERVAERLLRSGSLDDSAAQLLRPAGGAELPADASADLTVQADAAPVATGLHPLQHRSSLFAAAPVSLLPSAVASGVAAPPLLSTLPAQPLAAAAPAGLGQPRMQAGGPAIPTTAMLDRARDFG